jgi:hypothetical protein
VRHSLLAVDHNQHIPAIAYTTGFITSMSLSAINLPKQFSVAVFQQFVEILACQFRVARHLNQFV